VRFYVCGSCFLVARSNKLFCQKLIANLHCLLVYVTHFVFDSLLVNQLKSKSSNDFVKENIKLEC
jgi:hypothetical protein